MATPRKTAAQKATEAAAAAAEQAPAEETMQQKKNRLRNQAEREIIERHRDEYHALAEELFKAEGLEFTRRLTDAEKAQKKIDELLQQHPELRGKYGADNPAHVAAANAQEAAVTEQVEEAYLPEQDGPMDAPQEAPAYHEPEDYPEPSDDDAPMYQN